MSLVTLPTISKVVNKEEDRTMLFSFRLVVGTERYQLNYEQRAPEFFY